MIFDRLFSAKAPRRAKIPGGNRVYAVGDIHGCADLLDDLLARIEGDLAARPAKTSTIVFLGDLIDRGPKSRQVVERLRTLRLPGARAIFLAGNHEEALLRVIDGEARLAGDWLRFGGRECLDSYGLDGSAVAAMGGRDAARAIRKAIPPEHVAFLRSFGDTLSIGDYLFVHAGIRPGVALSRQNQTDLRWIRDAFLQDGRDHGFVVVHGHTISDQVIDAGNRIGIDTGAYSSGVLTALVLEGGERRYIQTGGKIAVSPGSIEP